MPGTRSVCGLEWGNSGVRPWRSEDLGGEGGLLDVVRQYGATFPNEDVYKGYTEVT
jgi:hypothetical protein